MSLLLLFTSSNKLWKIYLIHNYKCMDNQNVSKELLLFIASTLVSSGAIQITTNVYVGTGLLILGALIFVGRGYYKKYLQ